MNIPSRFRITAEPITGAALIITLAMLVIVTILVVGVAELVRIERPAAASHLEKARATEYAQIGVEKVVASLRKETVKATSSPAPSPAPKEPNWLSQPGQLLVSDIAATTNTVTKVVPLHSGLPSGGAATSGVLAPPNMNIVTFPDPNSHIITNRTEGNDPAKPVVSMKVKWVYVRLDGTLDLAEAPVMNNLTNPIVGRYAYWTDDESSKVNPNMAWGREATNPNTFGHPTRVSLNALPGILDPMADAIHNFVTINNYTNIAKHFYNCPTDVRQASTTYATPTDLSKALDDNRFELTHYNHDPDTTFFNEPRIVLTTQENKARGLPFLDILKTSKKNTEPTYSGGTKWNQPDVLTGLGDIDEFKFDRTLKMLNRYLSRTDWPVVSGIGSFQSKYYPANPQRLAQISLAIIDYVRSKECTEPLVPPIRMIYLAPPPAMPDAQTFFLQDTPVGADAFIGITRGPRITEVGVWLSETLRADGKYDKTWKVKVELYLPPKFGLTKIDLKSFQMFVRLQGNYQGEFGLNSTSVTLEPPPPPPPATTADLLSGNRAIITWTNTATIATPTTPRPSTATLRVAISRKAITIPSSIPSSLLRMDIAPLRDQGSSDYIVCKVDPAAVTEENMSSMEADDPRVNSHKDDWKACTASSPKQNTFGAINSISSIGKGPNISIVPQQDVDSLGKITDLSMVMPFPKGTAAKSSGTVEERTGNPKGLVGSAGELGYIHTGLESSTGGGKPWRTLRFQPNNSATTVVPDWAFMDLFTVPVESGAKGTTVFSPHQTATGGRLNMNAKAEPFGMERIYPLAAVVKGARKDALDPTKIVSDAEAQQIAKDIYNRALSLASTSHPAGKPYGYANGYDSPGEVVEIKGVADGGEASEELVREIANVITARGSVFGVYSVGQAVKQIPSGQLVVTGEQRLHTMIERYTVRTMDDKGTPLDLSDDTLKSEEVRFAPVYTRQLSP